jgi:hypothetical protein
LLRPQFRAASPTFHRTSGSGLTAVRDSYEVDDDATKAILGKQADNRTLSGGQGDDRGDHCDSAAPADTIALGDRRAKSLNELPRGGDSARRGSRRSATAEERPVADGSDEGICQNRAVTVIIGGALTRRGNGAVHHNGRRGV